MPEDEELDVFDFSDILMERMEMLEMDVAFAERHVNDGFSGGEKKRNEILQMAMLKPKLAVMDETDSGLDIDALKIVASGVNKLSEEDPEMSVLLITPLPASSRLYQAGFCPRHGRRKDCEVWRTGSRA